MHAQAWVMHIGIRMASFGTAWTVCYVMTACLAAMTAMAAAMVIAVVEVILHHESRRSIVYWVVVVD